MLTQKLASDICVIFDIDAFVGAATAADTVAGDKFVFVVVNDNVVATFRSITP